MREGVSSAHTHIFTGTIRSARQIDKTSLRGLDGVLEAWLSPVLTPVSTGASYVQIYHIVYQVASLTSLPSLLTFAQIASHRLRANERERDIALSVSRGIEWGINGFWTLKFRNCRVITRTERKNFSHVYFGYTILKLFITTSI